MPHKKILHNFKYKFDGGSGPVSLLELQKNNLKFGNCRLQVQDYFYVIHDMYLTPEQILLPEAFKKVGKFIKKAGETENFFEDLIRGDIIYAEKLRNKSKKLIYKGKSSFENEDEWILNFHTVIYLGHLNDEFLSHFPYTISEEINQLAILHSSFISGGTSIWSIEKFLHYYKPVAAKRIHL